MANKPYKSVLNSFTEVSEFVLSHDKVSDVRPTWEEQAGSMTPPPDDYMFSSDDQKEEVWKMIEANDGQVRKEIQSNVTNQSKT